MEREFDVFISYSTNDKLIANNIVSYLENNNIKCWIAPRNITPGLSWADAIVKGIDSSKILVLIFSSNVLNSDFVKNELNLASDKKIPIIPFRIENIMPKDDFKFYLSRTHWLDAFDYDINTHTQELIKTIKNLISINRIPNNTPNKKVSKDNVVFSPNNTTQTIQKTNQQSASKNKDKKNIYLIAGISIVAIVSFGLSLVFNLNFTNKIIIFVILFIFYLFIWYNLYKRISPIEQNNYNQYEDTTGTVTKSITPTQRGKVIFEPPLHGSKTWSAIAKEYIKEGTFVKVIKITGHIVEVEEVKKEM